MVSPAETKPTLFRRYWPVLKWLLFVLVIAFVGRRAWQLWHDGDVGSVSIHWPWLLAALGFYGIGWLPSVLFWHRLIHQFGGTTSRWNVAQAFFVGHLGKYIPGKASVLLIRAGVLADRGCRPGVAALTSTYETLTYMGVGAAIGLTLAPVVWPREIVADLPSVIRPAFDQPLLFGLVVVAVCVVLIPFVAKLLGLIARTVTPAVPADDVEANAARVGTESQPTGIRASFLLGWCLVFVTSWLVHGLSLGCTLRAVGVEASLSDWLTWTGDVSSASFLGFLAVFAPGGLGVREAALIELLKTQPGISPSQAVVASVLLRGTWLAAEIVATLGLSWITRRISTVKSRLSNLNSQN